MIINTIAQVKKNWILISICLFTIAISLIEVENNLIQGIIETIVLALLTYLGIRIANYLSLKKDVDEIIKEAILENSLNILKAERVGLIQNFYKKEAIDQVFKNCLNWYNPDLTNTYSDFFKNCLNTIQKNFDYTVRIFGKEGDPFYNISQTLSYHRIFKKEENSPIIMKCCFTLTNNVLDKILQDKTIFFREDLKSEELRQDIYTILSQNTDEETKKGNIIERLNLKLKINGNKIDPKNITLSFEKDTNDLNSYSYIMLSTTVDKESITQHYNNDDTQYVGYTGEIDCKYMSPNCDTFYCVFANPTIVSNKTTLFTITFPDHIKVDTVETMSFLPISKGQYEINIDSDNNIIKFLSEESILPRSGICFSW